MCYAKIWKKEIDMKNRKWFLGGAGGVTVGSLVAASQSFPIIDIIQLSLYCGGWVMIAIGAALAYLSIAEQE